MKQVSLKQKGAQFYEVLAGLIQEKLSTFMIKIVCCNRNYGYIICSILPYERG